MGWYPGKYAQQAAQAARHVADRAAKVAQTTVKQGIDELNSAYAEASRQFNDAEKEALDALQIASNRKMFEDKASTIIQERRDLIRLLRTASTQLTKDGYEALSKKLLTPGAVTSAPEAKALVSGYAMTSEAMRQAMAREDELHVFSIGWHGAAGAGIGVEVAGLGNPVPIFRFDRSELWPYPYREGSANIGPQVTAELGIAAGAFKGKANEQWGFFLVVSFFGDYEGPGANLDLYFSLPEGDFEGIAVGVNVAAGLPIGARVGVGRTFSLPLFYLAGGYGKATTAG